MEEKGKIEDLFRKKALDIYREGYQKLEIPMSMRPKTRTGLYALLCAVVVLLSFVLFFPVPIAQNGYAVLEQDTNGDWYASAFLKPAENEPLSIGMACSLSLLDGDTQVNGVVSKIADELLSPAEVNDQLSLERIAINSAATSVTIAIDHAEEKLIAANKGGIFKVIFLSEKTNLVDFLTQN